MTNDELVDLGNYPEIYADDVAEIQQLSHGNRRVVYFSWRKIDGIYRRTVTGAVIRPAATFTTAMHMFVAATQDAAPIIGALQ